MRNALLIVCCSVLASCSSSNARLVDAYRAPGTVSIVFERVAVFVLNGGPEFRASLEDKILKESGSPRLVAAHSVLPNGEMGSIAEIRRALVSRKCDGVATVRALRASEINPADSLAGISFTTYAGSVSPDEPPFGADRMRIEVSFYRLDDEELIWRGVVETTKTRDAGQLAQAIVSTVRAELRNTGLVHD